MLADAHCSLSWSRTTLVLAMCATVFSACGEADTTPSNAVVYEGAHLIVGNGSTIVEAVFLVEDGQFVQVGAAGALEIPAGATVVDLSGKTVMPAIVNAHVHLPTTRPERTELLRHMAYYGAGTVVSLGHDEGDVAFDMRSEVIAGAARSMTAGQGITRQEPGRSEVPFWIDTEDGAREAVRELAALDVDIVKIWVDDRSGRYDKLTPSLYGAVIDEAHANELKVTAHIFTLEDAKGLLLAGIDVFAHGIRDQDLDDELVALWLDRPGVMLVPNLPNPGIALDLSWLSGTVPADALQEMQAASQDRPAVQESFGIQARNLNRLNGAGIQIAFGTDGGSPWAVHLEMEDMVRSGMTPAEVIVAATSTSANLMGLPEVGSIEVGKSADFIVLDADPLLDITNTRLIDAVYLRGVAAGREAFAAGLRR